MGRVLSYRVQNPKEAQPMPTRPDSRHLRPKFKRADGGTSHRTCFPAPHLRPGTDLLASAARWMADGGGSTVTAVANGTSGNRWDGYRWLFLWPWIFEKNAQCLPSTATVVPFSHAHHTSVHCRCRRRSSSLPSPPVHPPLRLVRHCRRRPYYIQEQRQGV